MAISDTSSSSLSGNIQGALWMLGSCVMATAMSLSVKGLAPHLHSFQITFIRCVFGAFLVLPFVMHGRLRLWKTPARNRHLLRGLLVAVAMNGGYYAITKLELTTVTVLFFTAPLFVILFAALLLGEKVGPRRWAACGFGFLGTLIVLRPDTGHFEPAMLAALLSSVTFGLALIIGKGLSKTEPTAVMMTYTLGLAGLLSTPFAMAVWQPLDSKVILLLAVATLAGTIRGVFDIRAYSAGEASFVAPFQYARLVMILIAGYLIFTEIPEWEALAGGAVIIGSTLYIALREYQLKKATPTQAGPGP